MQMQKIQLFFQWIFTVNKKEHSKQLEAYPSSDKILNFTNGTTRHSKRDQKDQSSGSKEIKSLTEPTNCQKVKYNYSI